MGRKARRIGYGNNTLTPDAKVHGRLAAASEGGRKCPISKERRQSQAGWHKPPRPPSKNRQEAKRVQHKKISLRGTRLNASGGQRNGMGEFDVGA